MRLRALVFDDDPVIRRLLWMVLDRRGYEVFTFPNPGACPLNVSPHCTCPQSGACADIILSDLEMPEIKGLDFVEALLAKGCHCHHIALMSGAWSPANHSRASQLHCKLFVKPFSLGELAQWLDEVERAVEPNRVLTDWHTVKSSKP